jgi:galactose mutarotase-like enzyme
MNITISNGSLTATINSKGAELISLKDASGREYMWEGDPAFWGKHSPVLFPIVGTLKNNKYLYNENEYTLSRHGFARDMEFKIKEQTADKAVFLLSSNKETLKSYPFEFELLLTYTIINRKLEIIYSVVNKGTETMPFSLGAHPAFALPGEFTSYSLRFENDEPLIAHELENDLLSDATKSIPATGGVLPLSYNLFDKDALIFKNQRSRSVTILREQQPLLQVGYNDFPHLGIWTKRDAPFICIEPWQGYSDTAACTGTLMDKEGIKKLMPQQNTDFKLTIEILSKS